VRACMHVLSQCRGSLARSCVCCCSPARIFCVDQLGGCNVGDGWYYSCEVVVGGFATLAVGSMQCWRREGVSEADFVHSDIACGMLVARGVRLKMYVSVHVYVTDIFH
jgi:hypothetical protein